MSGNRCLFCSSTLRVVPVLFGLLILTACGALPVKPQLAQSLAEAGSNRGELEQVLSHYRELGEPLKIRAAEFLIANMSDKGFSLVRLADTRGRVIPYDATRYDSYQKAASALNGLEQKYAGAKFRPLRFDADLATMKADYLIRNIDLAFAAWRSKPWAKKVSFDTFLNYILPYRGSNEPLDNWREPMLTRYAGVVSRLTEKKDMAAAARLIEQDVRRQFQFKDLYYLHPTDQGFSEMESTGYGRCEDRSNMIGYGFKANAIPSASDYTPYWADRDNNHQWQVVLDENGRGHTDLSNRAAKVYRYTFALQPDSLAYRLEKGESAPEWLGGKHALDVTDQYRVTSDVRVPLTVPVPEGQRFVYLTVFNGGRWKAVAWAEIKGHSAIFPKMGREIAYVPMYFINEALEPAASAFILQADGKIQWLDGAHAENKTISLAISATTNQVKDADTEKTRARNRIKIGQEYGLVYWQNGWQLIERKIADQHALVFDQVPANRLYWLVSEGSRQTDRIFTAQQGKITIW